MKFTYLCHEIYCGQRTQDDYRESGQATCEHCGSNAVTLAEYVVFEGKLWSLEGTGGGCEAYTHYPRRSEDSYMLTAEGGGEIPEWGMPAILGTYDGNGDEIAMRDVAAFEPERQPTLREILSYENHLAYVRALRAAEEALRNAADSIDETTGSQFDQDLEATLRDLAGQCWAAYSGQADSADPDSDDYEADPFRRGGEWRK